MRKVRLGVCTLTTEKDKRKEGKGIDQILQFREGTGEEKEGRVEVAVRGVL